MTGASTASASALATSAVITKVTGTVGGPQPQQQTHRDLLPGCMLMIWSKKAPGRSETYGTPLLGEVALGLRLVPEVRHVAGQVALQDAEEDESADACPLGGVGQVAVALGVGRSESVFRRLV